MHQKSEQELTAQHNVVPHQSIGMRRHSVCTTFHMRFCSPTYSLHTFQLSSSHCEELTEIMKNIIEARWFANFNSFLIKRLYLCSAYLSPSVPTNFLKSETRIPLRMTFHGPCWWQPFFLQKKPSRIVLS